MRGIVGSRQCTKYYILNPTFLPISEIDSLFWIDMEYEEFSVLRSEKEQALLLKDRGLTFQRSQRNIYLTAAIAFLFTLFLYSP